ncbi:hypothetical protein ADK86_15790 [Streptomyces sp. NRRL F-5755]|uniref:hypothetical protein n=1 Tax=Streptomyces sp. NRRL F-5755 TaxID=1519475 RepID=UPI0006B01B95|nr:hypothetical protein [Streptomyces sp. NRRL F-5755]KOT99084.1 hypothetical protein ADK86_15790 [Streptomyces sp. NRRL F-5755]
MASKITVPVHRARRALAAAIAWSAGEERRSAGVWTVDHGADARTGPADLDLALDLAEAEARVAGARMERPAEVAAAARPRPKRPTAAGPARTPRAAAARR